MRISSDSWRLHLLVVLAYVLLSLAFTWPLVASLGTHVPGNGVDDPPLTWNLWWVQHAALDLGINPFEGTYLFYPLGINLAFYTLTVLNGFLSIPLQAAFGLVPASNLLLLSSFVLGGFGVYLLASYCLGSLRRGSGDGQGRNGWSLCLAAFAAGAVYAFSSSKLGYAALGQWNIASSQWIPFYTLYLFKLTEHPRQWRYPLMAGLFLLLQAYAELTFASFLVLFTALWALWQLWVWLRTRTVALVRIGVNMVLVGSILGVGLVPVLAMMIPDMIAEGDILVEGSGFADVFSADLLGYLVPTMHHSLLGSLVDRFSFDHDVGQHIFAGFAVLAMAALGAVYWWGRAAPESDWPGRGKSPGRSSDKGPLALFGSPGYWVRFWALSTTALWLLTLGPTLRINGRDTGLPLPFALVAQLPFFEGNRYPSRYSVMLVLGLAVLAAFGLAALLRSKRSRRWPVVASIILLAITLFEHIAIPLPLSDMRVPEVYDAVSGELGSDGTLLDLPVAWRNGFRVTGTQHPIIMFQQYYQSAHGRPILAGNTSRNPPLKFQYFAEAPVLNTLIALETGHQVDPAVFERDRALASDVLRFFGIQAIVVHPEQAGEAVMAYVENTLPVSPLYEDNESLAFQTELPPWPDAWVLEPGDELSRLSFAEGWGVPAHGVIWAQRPAARLLVPLSGDGQQVGFWAYAPDSDQVLRIEVNGTEVQSIQMAPGWMDYEASLPAEIVNEGLNEVWLRFATRHPTSQMQVSPRAIGQTGIESPVNLVVQSAGQEIGNFGHIFVDGKDVSPNQRGYNVAVLHPKTGVVEQVKSFDTHLDEHASQALATFLANVPAGRIVAMAAADEASRLLGPEAVTALHGIGASGDLENRFRWGHAIIGVQGAQPDTALEGLDWMRPITLAVGEGATEPQLAAAFSAIAFSDQ